MTDIVLSKEEKAGALLAGLSTLENITADAAELREFAAYLYSLWKAREEVSENPMDHKKLISDAIDLQMLKRANDLMEKLR